ncbi:YbaB/EbfC family nucleoid-associated protein [Micromonospora echinofusca]|uniref:YbaB/EbfC family DNA-binding protein n=1 Tax=Micromonospora echinofusca TaxID=47858 RepID=A0ABS3VSG1_MICEH|nr:YbaB/EbfC family nucleoid-associated protein [Micromonospora echinofusca]MBO4207303.1 YbaB/EbfC family DNA-binding protein [Micromonospora echinofusca]
MFVPENARLEELAAEYHRMREAALRAQERMRTATATVTSPKGLVTVVVGAQGEVRSITFASRAYRNMAPAELADAILDTINRARDTVLRELTEDLPANPPGGMLGGMTPEDILNGKIDLSGLLPESLDLGDLPFPFRPAPEAFRRPG